MYIALAVPPYVSEQHEVPRIQHPELERVDLARERADAELGFRRRGIGFALRRLELRLGHERLLDARAAFGVLGVYALLA